MELFTHTDELWFDLREQLRALGSSGQSSQDPGVHELEVLMAKLHHLPTLALSIIAEVGLRRNSLLAVSRLPNEILCHIFGYLEIRSLIAGA